MILENHSAMSLEGTGVRQVEEGRVRQDQREVVALVAAHLLADKRVLDPIMDLALELLEVVPLEG